MKKKLFLLLSIFSFVALTGGIYLAYTSERSFSEFNTIINLHHVENLREHLLLNVQKVEIDLYSQKTLHPESRLAIESDLSDLEKAINGCYSCHHVPLVLERLDDLRQQIDQYKSSIGMVLAIPQGTSVLRNTHRVNAHVIGDSLIGKIETMVVATSEKLRDRTDNSLRKAQSMKVFMIMLIAAGPVIMILFAFTVIQGVAAPVQALLEATRFLKAGNLEHRVTGLKDEFGELAVAFNDMAESMLETMRAIEESERRYRLLFESAADAIFILEAEGEQAGKILQANHAAAIMHGYTADELAHMSIQDLDTPDAAAEVGPKIERIKRGEWIKAEINHQKKDGSIFPVEMCAGLLETGGHKFILAMDRDISERKRAERDLQRTERIRVAGELAAGLAHEIKNPLAGIKVSMEALSEETYLTRDDRDVLNKVIGEIKRIEYLMQGLLSFAHPPKPQLLSTDVNAVLEAVASLVAKESARTRDESRAIVFVRELDEDLPDVMADPMQLKQIFMNLMLNAVDAMPEGGALTMRTAFDRERDQIRIELSDTGRGIDHAALGKIFNPFFTTKSKGTGLGLSITRRLVEEHGGRIRIENNRGSGVTCRITMPLRQTAGALAV